MCRRRRKYAPVTLCQRHDLILVQRRGKHREVVYHATDAIVAVLVTTNVQEVDVARKRIAVHPVMEELTVYPDLLRILVLDEHVVVPCVEHVQTPSSYVGRVRVDPLRVSTATTGRVPVNLAVAPRHVRLHRTTRLRPETGRARDRVVLLPERHRHLVHRGGYVQKLTVGNVHMLVGSIGHVHRRPLMGVIGKRRAVAQLTHQPVHVVDRRSVPYVQVEIPEPYRVGAIPELIMPKVGPRPALSIPAQRHVHHSLHAIRIGRDRRGAPVGRERVLNRHAVDLYRHTRKGHSTVLERRRDARRIRNRRPRGSARGQDR